MIQDLVIFNYFVSNFKELGLKTNSFCYRKQERDLFNMIEDEKGFSLNILVRRENKPDQMTLFTLMVMGIFVVQKA